MKSKTVCVLMLLIMAVPGALRASVQEEWGARKQRRLSTSEVQPGQAFTKWRRIGLRSAGQEGCPDAGAHWTVEPLLKEAQRHQAEAVNRPTEQALRGLVDDLHRLGLDRFCVYTADDPVAHPFPERLPAGLEAAGEDRMAMAPLGTLADTVAPVLAQEFLDQAGAPAVALPGAPRVRLTFLDTQPDTQPGDDPSLQPAAGHGYTLMRLAHGLLCPPSSSCQVQVASRQALHYTGPVTVQAAKPVGKGEIGNVGLVSDLAAAIVDAVVDWKRSGDTAHLVLNLSVGWDGELFGDLNRWRRWDPSVRAVHNALRFAADQGALVIAAAGNRRGGPVPSHWPLLPAAWELWHRWPRPGSPGGRLVYAVGGVDWQGVPLPNSRAGGLPWLAAYGDHAVAQVAGGYTPSFTPIYTGTSVSAAVVSSAAAAVWALRPELRPAEVMRIVSLSGTPAPARAEFYPWRGLWWPLSWLRRAPHMQRVSLCRAAERACRNGACPGAELPACQPLEPPRPPKLWPQFPDVLAKVVGPSPFQAASLPAAYMPPCDARTKLLTLDGSVPLVPCPADQFASVTSQRWTHPQPTDDPCPACTIIPKPPMTAELAPGNGDLPHYYALKLAVAADWKPVLVGAMLDIDRFDADGVFLKRMTYQIDLSQGIPEEVDGLGDGDPLQHCRAQVNFVALENGQAISVQNPVVVDP